MLMECMLFYMVCIESHQAIFLIMAKMSQMRWTMFCLSYSKDLFNIDAYLHALLPGWVVPVVRCILVRALLFVITHTAAISKVLPPLTLPPLTTDTAYSYVSLISYEQNWFSISFQCLPIIRIDIKSPDNWSCHDKYLCSSTSDWTWLLHVWCYHVMFDS